MSHGNIMAYITHSYHCLWFWNFGTVFLIVLKRFIFHCVCIVKLMHLQRLMRLKSSFSNSWLKDTLLSLFDFVSACPRQFIFRFSLDQLFREGFSRWLNEADTRNLWFLWKMFFEAFCLVWEWVRLVCFGPLAHFHLFLLFRLLFYIRAPRTFFCKFLIIH